MKALEFIQSVDKQLVCRLYATKHYEYWVSLGQTNFINR